LRAIGELPPEPERTEKEAEEETRAVCEYARERRDRRREEESLIAREKVSPT
jgi:hypothetical protein